MKIRNGFVSNSSSSSFILGVKGDLTKDKLLKLFNVDKSSIFYTFAVSLCDCIIELKDVYDPDDWHIDDADKLIKQGYTVYTGAASSDGEAIEAAFCDMDFNYESDDFVFIKESGY